MAADERATGIGRRLMDGYQSRATGLGLAAPQARRVQQRGQQHKGGRHSDGSLARLLNETRNEIIQYSCASQRDLWLITPNKDEVGGRTSVS
jgi:hypothetical protein